LASAGECISEVTFYRNDKTYNFNGVLLDYGIAGMAYKTTTGKIGTFAQ